MYLTRSRTEFKWTLHQHHHSDAPGRMAPMSTASLARQNCHSCPTSTHAAKNETGTADRTLRRRRLRSNFCFVIWSPPRRVFVGRIRRAAFSTTGLERIPEAFISIGMSFISKNMTRRSTHWQQLYGRCYHCTHAFILRINAHEIGSAYSRIFWANRTQVGFALSFVHQDYHLQRSSSMI